MLYDDYLCLVKSGKQQIKEVRKKKIQPENLKQRQLLSESGFVLRIAPPPLSRNRRIKMKKKSIYQSIRSKRYNDLLRSCRSYLPQYQLSTTDGVIPLSDFHNGTSKLAGLLFTLSLQRIASCREALNTNLKVVGLTGLGITQVYSSRGKRSYHSAI